MRPKTLRHIAALMLAVTGYFLLGNSLFVHTHVLDDGHIIAHSHPFIPGSHHGHSDTALLSLAELGAEMTADRENDIPVFTEPLRWEKIYTGSETVSVSLPTSRRSLRAPPAI